MSTITSIDRATAKQLAAEIDAALAAVADRHGIVIHTDGAKYSPTNVTFKLSVAVKDANGAALDTYARAFDAYKSMYQMENYNRGYKFRINGRVYTIAGLNTKAHRMPICCTRDDGRGFKFHAFAIKSAVPVV